MDLPAPSAPPNRAPRDYADTAGPALAGAARAIGWLAVIVALLLLGSLFWSAIGAFANSWQSAAAAAPNLAIRPAATRAPGTATALPASVPAAAPGPSVTPAPAATPGLLAPPALADATAQPTRPAALPTPSPARTAAPASTLTPQPSPAASPSPVASTTPAPSPSPDASPSPAPATSPTPAPTAAGRVPWVLLPRPDPGTRVSAGAAVLEARGRGEAEIVDMRLELDGVRVPAAVDQRSDSIWRAQAGVTLSPGTHRARAIVVDAAGRTGAYAWTFDAQ